MAKDTLNLQGVKGNITNLRPAQLLRISLAKNKKEMFVKAAQGLLPLVDWKNILSEENVSAPNIQLSIQKMKKTSAKATAEDVKSFLITAGWDKLKVRKGIKVVDDKIVVGGSLKDTLDYEFYGNPKGTWPNASRLRKWVRTVVIPSNPYLMKKHEEVRRHRKQREGMIRDLTYVIGREIFKNGLQKKSHWYYEKAEELRLAEQSGDPKLMVKYKGKTIPIGSRYGKGSGSKSWIEGGRMR